MEGFSTYSALARNESDPRRPLGWALKALGGIEPQYSGDPAGRAASRANRVGGPDLALRRLEIDEGRDIAMTRIGALEGVVTYIVGIGLGKIGGG